MVQLSSNRAITRSTTSTFVGRSKGTGSSSRTPRFTALSLTIVMISAFQIGSLSSQWKTDHDWQVHPSRALSIATSSDPAAIAQDYELASRESNGFFDDIPTTEWQRLKEKAMDIYPNVFGGAIAALRNRPQNANKFFQDHYEPDFVCRHERRIGSLGDGGKWVCDPHRLALTPSSPTLPCLVYSVGSNGNSSFEAAVKQDIGIHCEIHTFDMRNYSEVVETTGAHFHQWGISDQSMKNQRGHAYKTLKETVQELGHVGRTIDIFKIDCEGCEWSTFPTFVDAGVELRQVLVVLHAVENGANFGKMPMPETMDFFESMYQQGYVIFHKEVNIRFGHFGRCIQYAFLKLHKDFIVSTIPVLAVAASEASSS